MKIGIFGGTFDPIHNAHIIIAEQTLEKYNLDLIIFVPSYISYMKKNILFSVDDRLKMVILATMNNPKFKVSSVDIDRGGNSYTIDTVKDIIEQYGNENEYYFLLGEDNEKNFLNWKQSELIQKLVSLIWIKRDIDISSTIIRKKILSGESIKQLVCVDIENYIKFITRQKMKKEERIKPKLKINIEGEEGNEVVILGNAMMAWKNAKLPNEEWNKILKQATSSDYDNLIETMKKYFDVS